MKILWTKQAKEDIESIYEFIAQDSLMYAQLTQNEIIEVTQKLKRFPNIGRIVPELQDNTVRELFYKNYRIVYEVRNKTAYIVTIVHTSRILEM